MTTIFNIPANKIVEVKNPYAPQEIQKKFPEDYAYIAIVGLKDSERLLKSNYFEMYQNQQNLEGYRQKGYV